MKTVERYICEICGTIYLTKDEALKCEENHKKPNQIVSCIYESRYTEKRGYPIGVMIKMCDGTHQMYVIQERK